MYDEAYNGWDALQLMETGRLTPFLPDNNGRESGWHYWLMPFLAAFGARPFALHFAAGVTGILTVAAVYRLGRELVDRRVGLWAAAGLAVLYWHVHLSHLGLRAITMPLVGALAAATLLRARRTDRPGHWALGGLLVGLLAYTYVAARLWMLLAAGFLAWWALEDRRGRRDALLALGVAALVSLPQWLYLLRHPDASLLRVSTVAVAGPGDVWRNALRWSHAFFGQGDPNPDLNLALRPILDWALAAPFVAGIVASLARGRPRQGSLWLWGLALTGVAASLFSDAAPHFLRAVGLVVPLALILGLGADALARRLYPVLGLAAGALVLALFVAAAALTFRDFGRWLRQDSILRSMEMYVNEPAAWIRREAPPGEATVVYFSPFSRFHPNVAFHGYGLAPRRVGGFRPEECLVIGPIGAYYANVPAFASAFEEAMTPWAALSLRAEAGRRLGEQPLYRLYALESAPLADRLSPAAAAPVFDEAIRVRHTPLPAGARPGETLSFWLAFTAEAPAPVVLSAFVHLHGEPSPYAGGPLWAEQDRWLCEPYPATVWRPDETVLQPFRLDLPADLPPGVYEVAVGLHEAPAGPRLPLTAPAPNLDQFAVIHRLRVTE